MKITKVSGPGSCPGRRGEPNPPPRGRAGRRLILPYRVLLQFDTAEGLTGWVEIHHLPRPDRQPDHRLRSPELDGLRRATTR